MNIEDLDKLINFLKNYQLLYGDNYIIDIDSLEEKVKNWPDIQIKMGQMKEKTEKIKPHSPTEKPNTPLWNFMREIKDCMKCPLGQTRTKFVFGEGNENADIMFIGEAPGGDEDRTGIPFVGRAGKLLDKLLEDIQIKREEVFIANILKCRPPGNRDPLPSEIEQCFPYLFKQIELIKPKIIVALGRISGQRLLNTTASLKQLRGRIWQYRGVNLIVTYHPAAILRNAGLLETAKEDFKFIAETYREILKHKK